MSMNSKAPDISEAIQELIRHLGMFPPDSTDYSGLDQEISLMSASEVPKGHSSAHPTTSHPVSNALLPRFPEAIMGQWEGLHFLVALQNRLQSESPLVKTFEASNFSTVCIDTS